MKLEMASRRVYKTNGVNKIMIGIQCDFKWFPGVYTELHESIEEEWSE